MRRDSTAYPASRQQIAAQHSTAQHSIAQHSPPTHQPLQQRAALLLHALHVAHELEQRVELAEAAEVPLRPPVQVLQPDRGVSH
jgi:hypothetical protein